LSYIVKSIRVIRNFIADGIYFLKGFQKILTLVTVVVNKSQQNVFIRLIRCFVDTERI